MRSQRIGADKGSMEGKQEIMEVDGDGKTQEVGHEERELVGTVAEEHVPYRRGR